MGGDDLAAEAADIGKTHVIGQDDHDVGAVGFFPGGGSEGEEESQAECHYFNSGEKWFYCDIQIRNYFGKRKPSVGWVAPAPFPCLPPNRWGRSSIAFVISRFKPGKPSRRIPRGVMGEKKVLEVMQLNHK